MERNIYDDGRRREIIDGWIRIGHSKAQIDAACQAGLLDLRYPPVVLNYRGRPLPSAKDRLVSTQTYVSGALRKPELPLVSFGPVEDEVLLKLRLDAALSQECVRQKIRFFQKPVLIVRRNLFSQKYTSDGFKALVQEIYGISLSCDSRFAGYLASSGDEGPFKDEIVVADAHPFVNWEKLFLHPDRFDTLTDEEKALRLVRAYESLGIRSITLSELDIYLALQQYSHQNNGQLLDQRNKSYTVLEPAKNNLFLCASSNTDGVIDLSAFYSDILSKSAVCVRPFFPIELE